MICVQSRALPVLRSNAAEIIKTTRVPEYIFCSVDLLKDHHYFNTTDIAQFMLLFFHDFV